MADERDGIGSLLKDRKVAVLLFTAVAASVVATLYHLLSLYLRSRQQPAPAPAESAERIMTAELIPAHKYRRGEGLAGEACAVCLGEFEEGEELRALPWCDHAFHVECIDMWLFSHVTCPICRANATPELVLNVDDHSRR